MSDAPRKRRKSRPSAPGAARPATSRPAAPPGAATSAQAGSAPPAARGSEATRKLTPEERKAARAADKAAAAAHRRAAALATAGGPIAPADGPDLDLPPEPPSRTTRSEAKNQAVRASLEPLPKGERPQWVTYAALLAAFLGLLNLGLYAAGSPGVKNADFGSTVLIALVLLICAAGMWRAIYQAVLAFEVLLGVTVAIAALSLMFINSYGGAIRSLLTIGIGGLFFWKLIRAMARLQMPERPGQPPRR